MLLNRDREGIIIDCVIVSYRGVGVNPNFGWENKKFTTDDLYRYI